MNAQDMKGRFCSNARTLLEKEGMTAAELSQRSGVSVEILEELEAGSLPLSPPPGESSGDAPQGQVSLMDVGGQRVLERLRRIDVNTLTPIEALNVLFELKKCVE